MPTLGFSEAISRVSFVFPKTLVLKMVLPKIIPPSEVTLDCWMAFILQGSKDSFDPSPIIAVHRIVSTISVFCEWGASARASHTFVDPCI